MGDQSNCKWMRLWMNDMTWWFTTNQHARVLLITWAIIRKIEVIIFCAHACSVVWLFKPKRWKRSSRKSEMLAQKGESLDCTNWASKLKVAGCQYKGFDLLFNNKKNILLWKEGAKLNHYGTLEYIYPIDSLVLPSLHLWLLSPPLCSRRPSPHPPSASPQDLIVNSPNLQSQHISLWNRCENVVLDHNNKFYLISLSIFITCFMENVWMP